MRIAQVVIDAKIYHHQCVVAKKKQNYCTLLVAIPQK